MAGTQVNNHSSLSFTMLDSILAKYTIEEQVYVCK